MLHLKINGQPHEVEPGVSVLQALRQAGVSVPTLCYDERLKPYGGCRLCVVEVEGSERLVPACTTPCSDGLSVLTHSPQVIAQRKTNLELLAYEYPADEPLSEHVEFHRYLMEYGVLPKGAIDRDAFKDFEHPYLRVDMDKCVYCYRCVRICDEVQGQFAWRAWNRGDRTRILPDKGLKMLDSSCVSCGACADTCPSGAIQDRLVVEQGQPDKWTRTTCPYCGTGCEMWLGTREGKVVVAKPVLDAPVNKGHLCVKGRYAHAFVHSQDRATEPMIRVEGEWQVVSWDEALTFAASWLREIVETQGPSAVGVLGSARATNEENYLAQKFARVVLGSNNVDCCARVCHGPTAAALKMSFGTGAATNSFNDIEEAGAFLICGANPTENHPIVGARIKQAVLKGASLVVIDPRVTELAALADVHLQIKPGTNLPILHGLASVILEQGWEDKVFVASRTEGIDEYLNFLRDWNADKAAELCGVSAEAIREAAWIYSHGPSMIFHGLGATEHTQGTEGVRCLANLALLTGNVGKPGTGENPLRGQNNVQGSAHMGCEPSNLAGYVPIQQSAEWTEDVWGAPVPRDPGLTWMKMLDAAVEGKLKALWAIGYDVYLSNPNANRTAEGLRNLDLLIVQDLFLSETAREFANVFFPACSSYEKDGTFMNSERRVQRVRQAIPPIGNSLPDWQIVCRLAERMGKAQFFSYDTPEEIWEEVRKVWKAGSGISYARIEEGGLQWPCPDEDSAGTTILHKDRFPLGERAPLAAIPYKPTPERTSAEFPFLLNTGRTLYQFNAGTMTFRTRNVVMRPTDTLDINPADATRLDISDGDPVLMESKFGSAVLPARLDERVRLGELFATFHDPRIFTNKVINNLRDTTTGAGEYKVTAVRLTKASASEEKRWQSPIEKNLRERV